MNKLILLFSFLLLISCRNEKNQVGPFADVEIQNLKTFLSENSSDLIVLDVRTPEEINEGKIVSTALELDFYDDAFETKLDQLDKNKNYLVYCRSGGRSGKTVSKMKKKGFKSAHNLLGGYSAWSDQ